MIKYRVYHPPGGSYTEFLTAEAAAEFRDANWPDAPIEILPIPEPIPDPA